MNEFTRRCKKVSEELNALAQDRLMSGDKLEYYRLIGKAEGVRLAQSYAEEEISRLELLAAQAALKKEGTK
jgi:hypothetical protein